MVPNIKIKAIDIYHPNHVIENDFYINHFQKKGRDIQHFLEVMGREKRYVIDKVEENGLTMALEATKRVLERAGMTGKDLDYIEFSTQVPETTFPINAMYVHAEIQADHDTIIKDSNANCAGMTVAVEQASRYMLANPHIHTALIVGSDYNSLIANPEQEITYANYGDAACAVILEKTDENTGFIDASYHTDSVFKDKINYPAHGLTKAVKGKSDVQAINWLSFDGNVALPPTYKMIDQLLARNGLSIKDIDACCFSQFALSNILKIQDHYQIDQEKIIYVGDTYAYTGTSSPFIALYEGIKSGRIKRGDNVLFWTIGSGFQIVAMLYQY